MQGRLPCSLALAGLAVGVALGCASDAEQVADHIAAAERYQEQGDARSALVELQSALRIDPKNADLNFRLAQLLAAIGSPQRAAFYYGEAYRLDPSRTEAALQQAPIFYGSDPAAARALVEEVIEREPQNPVAQVRRAEVLLLEEKLDEALAAALTAVELDREEPLAHRTVGTVHRARAREKTLVGEDVDPAIREAAIAAYERAAAFTADLAHEGAWYDRLQIALVHVEWEGHEEQARQAFREAWALARDKDDRIGQATVVQEAQRLARARQDPDFTRWTLERWVEVQPAAERAWSALASLEARQGGSAQAVWKRALEGQPEDLRLHAAYVRYLSEAGQDEQAFAHLASAPAEIRDTPDMGALRVELYLSKRDLDGARNALRALEADHPESVMTRLARARLDLQADRVEEALQTLRNLSGEFERADVMRQLAVAEARAENVDAAIAAADRAIELQPIASPTPHIVRARMLALKDDWPGVLRAYREYRRLGLPVGVSMASLRIRALYESDRRSAAKRLLERALTGERPPLSMVLLYYQYESAADPQGVRRYLEDAITRHPNDSRPVRALVLADLQAGESRRALERLEAYQARLGRPAMEGLRAQILWALGRKDESEAAVRALFATTPRPPGAAGLLVRILSQRGRADEALALLDEARRQGGLDATSLWQLGRLHLQRGQLEPARQRLEEAHRAAPDRLHFQNDLAWVLAEIGTDLDRAVELAREVKAGLPGDSAVADTLGYVYLKKGLVEPAAFEFRSAIELARVNGNEVADYHYHLGLALEAQGRIEDARAAFAEALRIEPQHEAAEQARDKIAAAGPGAG